MVSSIINNDVHSKCYSFACFKRSEFPFFIPFFTRQSILSTTLRLFKFLTQLKNRLGRHYHTTLHRIRWVFIRAFHKKSLWRNYSKLRPPIFFPTTTSGAPILGVVICIIWRELRVWVLLPDRFRDVTLSQFFEGDLEIEDWARVMWPDIADLAAHLLNDIACQIQSEPVISVLNHPVLDQLTQGWIEVWIENTVNSLWIDAETSIYHSARKLARRTVIKVLYLNLDSGIAFGKLNCIVDQMVDDLLNSLVVTVNPIHIKSHVIHP